MIVAVVRYALTCDRCGANTLTDAYDHYDIDPADFPEDTREAAEYLGWSSCEQDLCPTCADETSGEGHDYVGVFTGVWTVLRGPVGLSYRDCKNRGCLVTEFSDGSTRRRVPDHPVFLAAYTGDGVALAVQRFHSVALTD